MALAGYFCFSRSATLAPTYFGHALLKLARATTMKRTTLRLIITLILSLLVAPLTAEAQQATTVHRIGRLSPGFPTEPNPNLEAFRQGLRELGYVEGQNLMIESRYAEGREERLPDLAAELVRVRREATL